MPSAAQVNIVVLVCRRRISNEQRKERQEKRDRKELVERLLAEHEEREQAELYYARYALLFVNFVYNAMYPLVFVNGPKLSRYWYYWVICVKVIQNCNENGRSPFFEWKFPLVRIGPAFCNASRPVCVSVSQSVSVFKHFGQ